MEKLLIINLDAATDDWEDLIGAGIQLAEMQDRDRWQLGELAARCVGRYGDDAFNKYATAIDVKSKTLYDYKRVFDFYGKNSARAENLRWSHYRKAMEMKDKAQWALDKASIRDWPCWKFEKIINRYLGKGHQTRESIEGTIARRYDQEDGRYLVIRLLVRNQEKTNASTIVSEGRLSFPELPVGQNVTIKVKAS
jgi:hypothetical protein